MPSRGGLGAAHDVLEVRVAERTSALSEANAAPCASERKVRAIFDQTFQHIGLLTPDGILLEVNRPSLEFGGLDRSEVIGRPFWSTPWWSRSSEGRERLKAAIAAAAGGEFVRFEAEVLGAGGGVATLDYSINPVRDESGRVVLLIPEGRDITDRIRLDRSVRANETKFRALLEFAPDPIILIDHGGRIVLSNARTVETFGYAAEELHGQPVELLVPEELRRRTWSTGPATRATPSCGT